MMQVIVGVALTAVLGGLLVPSLKEILDRRSEQFRSSIALVDTLADNLWTYWKLALRVAYYGMRGQTASNDLELALARWDSDSAWQIGSDIQSQVSRSRRLLPPAAQEKLNATQQVLIDYLDYKIDTLRNSGTAGDWEEFYDSLKNEKRSEIDLLLGSVAADLRIRTPNRRRLALTAGRGL